MNVTSTVDKGLLQVVAAGEFSLEEAQRTFLEVLEAVKQHHTSKVFFDSREVIGDPLVIERFYYGEFAALSVERLVKNVMSAKAPKFAYVLQEPLLDPLRLGETVAVNRGMNVKAFNNAHEALQWLDTDADF